MSRLSISKQSRVYLAPGENPPNGMRVQIGERGGRFYVALPSLPKPTVPLKEGSIPSLNSLNLFVRNIPDNLKTEALEDALDLLYSVIEDRERDKHFVNSEKGLEGAVMGEYESDKKRYYISHIVSHPRNLIDPSNKTKGVGTYSLYLALKDSLATNATYTYLNPISGQSRNFFKRLGFEEGPSLGSLLMNRNSAERFVKQYESEIKIEQPEEKKPESYTNPTFNEVGLKGLREAVFSIDIKKYSAQTRYEEAYTSLNLLKDIVNYSREGSSETIAISSSNGFEGAVYFGITSSRRGIDDTLYILEIASSPKNIIKMAGETSTRGAGTHLMYLAFKKGLENPNIDHTALWALSDAIPFYHKLGFSGDRAMTMGRDKMEDFVKRYEAETKGTIEKGMAYPLPDVAPFYRNDRFCSYYFTGGVTKMSIDRNDMQQFVEKYETSIGDKLEKASKVYIPPGETPPKNVPIQTGKRGGRFYVSSQSAGRTQPSAGKKLPKLTPPTLSNGTTLKVGMVVRAPGWDKAHKIESIRPDETEPGSFEVTFANYGTFSYIRYQIENYWREIDRKKPPEKAASTRTVIFKVPTDRAKSYSYLKTMEKEIELLAENINGVDHIRIDEAKDSLALLREIINSAKRNPSEFLAIYSENGFEGAMHYKVHQDQSERHLEINELASSPKNIVDLPGMKSTRGAGTHLMYLVFKKGLSLGVDSIFFHPMPAAIPFYTSLGFDDTHANVMTMDHRDMERFVEKYEKEIGNVTIAKELSSPPRSGLVSNRIKHRWIRPGTI